MKFRMLNLTLALKQSTVEIPFDDVTYFHGQMGAGKTSIARLIDYCLGGSLDPSPALQDEFVSVTLLLELDTTRLSIERSRDSDRVVARWDGVEGLEQLSVPARKPSGAVLPETEVENLSDLVFYLSGIVAPEVRTSKVREDSELRRLSLRDLLWYCYLDQDEIDSTFFHLDKANDFKQYKSRDVLRFVLGFRNERIAEIESELDRLRGQRLGLSATLTGLRSALSEVGVDSEEGLQQQVEGLEREAEAFDARIAAARARLENSGDEYEQNAVDALRDRARDLGNALERLDAAVVELKDVRDREHQHLHEVQTLAHKVRRSNAAKEILQDVAFVSCPRCTQQLPIRPVLLCSLCGQTDATFDADSTEALLVERDAKGRQQELDEVIERRDAGISALTRQREELLVEKRRAERELGEASRVYDSAFLSSVLILERDRASLQQRIAELQRLSRLPNLVTDQLNRLQGVQNHEAKLRHSLKAARVDAERDANNLDRLKFLFHDCLLRTSMPGVTTTDRVEIPSTTFLPAVRGASAMESTVTSFGNTSSGGKKTLFKACFAVAVHRLAVEIGATLPEWLMIDSPMKNISERENLTQFENFHRMLYELALGELQGTQIILIDKEYFAPPPDLPVALIERHMRPNEPGILNEFPPLIPYHTGH